MQKIVFCFLLIIVLMVHLYHTFQEFFRNQNVSIIWHFKLNLSKVGNFEFNKLPFLLEQQLKAFENVIMPDDTPIEIKSKLIVVLLNLGAKHLVRVSCCNEPK